jgi:amino acid transporter
MKMNDKYIFPIIIAIISIIISIVGVIVLLLNIPISININNILLNNYLFYIIFIIINIFSILIIFYLLRNKLIFKLKNIVFVTGIPFLIYTCFMYINNKNNYNVTVNTENTLNNYNVGPQMITPPNIINNGIDNELPYYYISEQYHKGFEEGYRKGRYNNTLRIYIRDEIDLFNRDILITYKNMELDKGEVIDFQENIYAPYHYTIVENYESFISFALFYIGENNYTKLSGQFVPHIYTEVDSFCTLKVFSDNKMIYEFEDITINTQLTNLNIDIPENTKFLSIEVYGNRSNLLLLDFILSR